MATSALYNPNTGKPLYQGESTTFNGITYVGATTKPASSSSSTYVAPTTNYSSSSSSSSSSSVGKNITSTSTSSIQQKLGVTADGIYGSNTTAAVKAFQQANGLTVDGIVGANTLAKMFPTTTTQNQTYVAPSNTKQTSTPVQTTNTNYSSSSSSSNSIGKNITSTPTTQIQQKLGVTVDGTYGSNTTAAVKAFQAANGLTVDGIVGPNTLAKMFPTTTNNTGATASFSNDNSQSNNTALTAGQFGGDTQPVITQNSTNTLNGSNLQQGSTGSGVTKLQNMLGIAADGTFGPQTLAAVKAFQQANGLTVDGIVGPATMAKLNALVGAPNTGATADFNTPTNTTDSIKELQTQLNEQNAGLPGWIPLEVDGKMGPLTEAAKNFTPVTTPTTQPIVTDVPPTTIPMPTFTNPTSTDTSAAYISSVTAQSELAKNTLNAAYQKQIDDLKAKEATAQANIDAMTAKENTALGDIKDLTAPFRQALEDAERERLHINENFEANQALTNELDSLLTDGNSLVTQLKGVTGLSSIRDPRVNQAIDTVNARVGVITAVMNARNGQINQAYNMIDRTTAAITADRNDQINYYNSLLSYYSSNKNVEVQKLANLQGDEKVYIQAKIAQLESDVASTKATSDAIKAALIDPNTALLYAQAGITLADSVQTINTKLANQTYLMEVSDSNNKMATAGFKYLAAGTSAPSGAQVVSITDSKGKQTNWYATGTTSSDAPATVKTDAGTFQWNPTTGRYDIPVGAGTGTSANPETVVQVKNTINAVASLTTMAGLNSAVGPNPLARWNPLELFNSEKSNYIAAVEQVISQLSLDNLIKVKAAGGTFGALSDREMDILSGSATKLAAYRVKNGDGKVVGYDTTEGQFKTELNTLVSTLTDYYNRLGGTTGSTTSSTTSTGTLPIIHSSVGDIDPNY